ERLKLDAGDLRQVGRAGGAGGKGQQHDGKKTVVQQHGRASRCVVRATAVEVMHTLAGSRAGIKQWGRLPWPLPSPQLAWKMHAPPDRGPKRFAIRIGERVRVSREGSLSP